MFWTIVAVLAAAVLIFAIWRGNINLGLSPGKITFATGDRKDPPLASKISVAKGIEISGSGAVGSITGKTVDGNDPDGSDIDVASGAKISGKGRVDKITGVDVQPDPPSKQ
jgi:hypothetical protein